MLEERGPAFDAPDECIFLQYQDENMAVFMSKSYMDMICQSEYLVADGTFEMAPLGYYQLYTIHGFRNYESELA